jgi:hypothetical protein
VKAFFVKKRLAFGSGISKWRAVEQLQRRIAAAVRNFSDTFCIRSANNQGNELKQQLRWPARRSTELASALAPHLRKVAIVNSPESRQRTIGLLGRQTEALLKAGSCRI